MRRRTTESRASVWNSVRAPLIAGFGNSRGQVEALDDRTEFMQWHDIESLDDRVDALEARLTSLED
jgi:polyhydroxyalkanoate synthesis regulator phasin